jgi:hypothetical protein
MADIELVIKIPEEEYKIIKNHTGPMVWVEHLIKKGTPLPKGHGRLIDADDIRVIELEDSVHIIRHEKGDEVDVYISAPTIIEADREVEEPEI